MTALLRLAAEKPKGSLRIGAIERFSEDIDVTIDFRDLFTGFDPSTGCRRSRQKILLPGCYQVRRVALGPQESRRVNYWK